MTNRPTADRTEALSDPESPDRCVLAGCELSLGRADLPARQPVAARATAGRARQAAAARALGHDAGAEPHLCAPEPADPSAGSERDLHRGPGPRRPRTGRERLPGGHVQRALSAHQRATRRGCARCSASSRSPAVSRATPRRRLPGSIHEGGELGYSLAHAYGAAFDNPDLLVACVVGDGEAETGPLATSWHANKFLNPQRDGAVLPILHLNGYKIANPTVLARIPERRARCAVRGLRLPAAVPRRPATSRDVHRLFAALARRRARPRSAEIQHAARGEQATERPRWPMIVLRTPKGWTGPAEVDGLPVEDTWRSHQVPLDRHRARMPEHLPQLEDVDAELPARGAVRRETARSSPELRGARARRASGG